MLHDQAVTDGSPASAAAGQLEGRAALVTGAASGIGRAVAERLTQAGMDVLAVDLEPSPGPGSAWQADLTDPQANEEAVQEALARFGRLDVIVANAGVQHVAPVEEFPLEQWQRIQTLMLTSPFLLAKHGWAALRDAPGGGRFIAIASVHGLVASPYKSAYVSAKHGVIGLVKTLALEGAEVGINAVAVCPGYVRTPLVEHQIESQAQAHGMAPERVLEEVILAPHVVKELIEPEEVGELVAFLAGPAGRAFTGVALPMDFGWTAR